MTDQTLQTDLNLRCKHMPTCTLCWIPAHCRGDNCRLQHVCLAVHYVFSEKEEVASHVSKPISFRVKGRQITI